MPHAGAAIPGVRSVRGGALAPSSWSSGAPSEATGALSRLSPAQAAEGCTLLRSGGWRRRWRGEGGRKGKGKGRHRDATAGVPIQQPETA